MADPTIQTFCCHHRNNSEFAVELMHEFDKDSYVITCMVSSAIGIAGALYQIFFRKRKVQTAQTSIGSTKRRDRIGRHIIVALAIADLCASIGVFTRSAVWKYRNNFVPMDDDTANVMFCAVSSAWTQLFYTATWIYTLLYAISVYVILKGETPNLVRYHIIVWSTSILLTAVGLTILYVPNADCHDIHEISTALLRVLPIYLVTYIPILLVMIINPILYYHSSKKFEERVAISQNQVTESERKLMKRFKLKFSFINIIFYCCWLPNLFSGVLLWFFWYTLPVKLIIGTWLCMAVLNPLQAFFNTLVYRKWTPVTINDKIKSWFSRRKMANIRKDRENTPLLGGYSNMPSYHSRSFDRISEGMIGASSGSSQIPVFNH